VKTASARPWNLITAEIEQREPRRRAESKTTSSVALRESRASKDDVTPKLEGAFKRLGQSDAGAKIAARGRNGRPAASNLAEAGQRLGLSSAGAKVFARGRRAVREAVKNVAGLPASCFAWVPDPEDATTWQLQIARSADAGDAWTPDEDLVRAAVAKLPGVATFGTALDIPAADLPAVKATLRAAWIACGASIDEMPKELQQEALRKAFRRLGMSESAAAVAARGRRL
jgi:hypothetical protein